VTESKIELTERLRLDGRWQEASRFKDTVLRECRAKGMKKAEASDAAWTAMAEAFPPLDTVDETVPFVTPGDRRGPDGDDLLDLDDLVARQPHDFPRDVARVYEHMADRKASPETAPGAGAWSLLLWARRNRNRFFENVLPKASRSRGTRSRSHAGWRRSPSRRFGRSSRGWRSNVTRSYSPTCPGPFGSGFVPRARRLEPSVRVTLPGDAAAALEAKIARLVQECTEVLGRASEGS
jgi:hypothetical protein